MLKLLRENCLGEVKMNYIAPPYNMGNDFVYNDNLDQEKQIYIHNSGQYDEEGNRLVTNTEINGRFHTEWLNMIYPLRILSLRTKNKSEFILYSTRLVVSLPSCCEPQRRRAAILWKYNIALVLFGDVPEPRKFNRHSHGE